MHVLKDQKNLGNVELDQISRHSDMMSEHVHQFTMLHIVHQDVDVPLILGHSSHLANELVFQLSHIFDLVEEMLLLLSL